LGLTYLVNVDDLYSTGANVSLHSIIAMIRDDSCQFVVD